ncbi:hypothetical protein GS426_04095 [Rhodococcus hoagii]|nr:hypothetical protein [Prescottella equi]
MADSDPGSGGRVHRAVAGRDPDLAPVGTSMRTWADGLVTAAQDRVDELELWRSMTEPVGPSLAARQLDPNVDVGATTDRVEIALSAEVTRALTTTVPRVFHGSVDDGLVSALALAVAQWRRERGVDVDAVAVTLEGHGREDHVVPGADLSRTVGWFTTLHPVRFDLSDTDLDAATTGGPASDTVVKAVKETMRSIPDHGIGFGLLRYLNDETRRCCPPARYRRSASTTSADSTPVRAVCGYRSRTPSCGEWPHPSCRRPRWSTSTLPRCRDRTAPGSPRRGTFRAGSSTAVRWSGWRSGGNARPRRSRGARAHRAPVDSPPPTWTWSRWIRGRSRSSRTATRNCPMCGRCPRCSAA